MTDKSGLGDRMKRYEHVSRNVLTRRTPVILRVDGRAFHTFTRTFSRPFDQMMHNAMVVTADALVREIQGAKLAYGQSDEISVLITDYDTLQTDAWFGNVIQKMVSIAASVSTIAFNQSIGGYPEYNRERKMAQFDARVFSIPKEEVANYFIWRQQDASRNSVSMVAQSHFSHKKLQGKNVRQMQDMLMAEHGINWNDTPTHFKRGFCIRGNDGIVVDREVPIFTEDRGYVERLVYLDDSNPVPSRV